MSIDFECNRESLTGIETIAAAAARVLQAAATQLVLA